MSDKSTDESDDLHVEIPLRHMPAINFALSWYRQDSQDVEKFDAEDAAARLSGNFTGIAQACTIETSESYEKKMEMVDSAGEKIEFESESTFRMMDPPRAAEIDKEHASIFAFLEDIDNMHVILVAAAESIDDPIAGSLFKEAATYLERNYLED